MAAPPAAIERSKVRRENDEVLTVVLSEDVRMEG